MCCHADVIFFILQTDSEGSAASACTKKNLIDQYFGVEFETTYPVRVHLDYLDTFVPHG